MALNGDIAGSIHRVLHECREKKYARSQSHYRLKFCTPRVWEDVAVEDSDAGTMRLFGAVGVVHRDSKVAAIQ